MAHALRSVDPNHARLAMLAVMAALVGFAGLHPLFLIFTALALAWAWRRDRTGRARHLRFTREGRYLVAITLGVGFAAINTGNNLLYLVLGMLLSMIVVSGVLSEHTLRALEIERVLPHTVHAGRPFLTGITLTNAKRRLPSFSVQVEDIIEGRRVAKTCYFLKVPAGTAQQTSYRAEFPRRGIYTYEGLRIGTRFPFSFFVKFRRLPAPAQLVVLPRVEPVAALPLEARALLGPVVRPRRGQGREFHGLRDYRLGDDARDVHWKRSARQGRLILREYARQGSREVQVVVNTALPAELDPSSPAVAAALDGCCDLAASLTVHLARHGYAVTLVADRAWPVSGDGRGAQAALRALALLEFGPSERGPRPEGGAPRLLVTHRAARHLAPGPFAHVFEQA